MEKIISIKETTFRTDEYNSYDGYEVVTDKQTIRMGIQNHQSCCEDWGYLMSEEDIQEFVGSTLVGISAVDEQLKAYPELPDYECSCMFINLNTDRGLLQFVAYNSHNGYYSHDAVLISTQLNHEESL